MTPIQGHSLCARSYPSTMYRACVASSTLLPQIFSPHGLAGSLTLQSSSQPGGRLTHEYSLIQIGVFTSPNCSITRRSKMGREKFSLVRSVRLSFGDCPSPYTIV